MSEGLFRNTEIKQIDIGEHFTTFHLINKDKNVQYVKFDNERVSISMDEGELNVDIHINNLKPAKPSLALEEDLE